MKRKDIIKALVERGYQAEAQDIVKNGVNLEGIMIRNGSPIAPIIYTDEIIKIAEANGVSLSEVVDEIISEYEQHRKIQFNMDQFISREFILSHVYIGIQKASNEDIEKKKCDLEGLETYLYVMDRVQGGGYSAKLSKHLLKLADLNENEVWQRAQKNTFAETQIQNMLSVLANLGYVPREMAEVKSDFPQMYIVTNKCKFRGASAILDKDALRAFGREHGIDKVIVIPSSIHEMLIMPYEGNMGIDDMSVIVAEVNTVKVEPEEQLADRAYLIEL